MTWSLLQHPSTVVRTMPTVKRGITHLVLAILLTQCSMGAVFNSGDTPALHRGVYEVTVRSNVSQKSLYVEQRMKVIFTRPDRSQVSVDAFYNGAGTWHARAYCDQVGPWQWQSQPATARLAVGKGTFEVVPSKLPGKLRKHPDDPFQFARDDGSWFLHIGDTGYRYVVATEPHWQAYIDQAAEAGFTKIRTWFAQARSTVEALTTPDRQRLALGYWQEIDQRLRYALERHPGVVFQLMPYAEDTQEIRRYAQGDPMAKLIGQAAQARWSAFPNVYWTLSNDREIVDKTPLTGRKVLNATINRIGRDFAAREPWGTLLTNHQSRFTGYAFVDAPWSDVITLEDIDQVHGRIIAKYRKQGSDPIVNDEDRYELYRSAGNRRYFFRRLMWGSLLSGGHASYGGLRTYEAFDGGPRRGVQGYFDANRKGVLFQGAHDFIHLHSFFAKAGITLVGLQPNDALVGGNPLQVKCAANEKTVLIYLANPTGNSPDTDNPAAKKPSVTIRLNGDYTVRWFNPRTGTWIDGQPLTGRKKHTLTAPAVQRTRAGDWVLLLRRK
jgi:hypothetical protein